LPRRTGPAGPRRNPDHSTAICIWEGPSLDAVRDLVESTVGEYSENEYYEVELEAGPV
jgi:hypothetical protein